MNNFVSMIEYGVFGWLRPNQNTWNWLVWSCHARSTQVNQEILCYEDTW